MEITKDKLEGQRKLVQGLEKQRDEIVAKFNEQNNLFLAMDDAYEAQQRLGNLKPKPRKRPLTELEGDIVEGQFELYVEQLREMGIPVHHFTNDELKGAFESYQYTLRGNVQ